MNKKSHSCSPVRERGFSLVEVLVASAILTTIIIAALLVYDRSNRIFKESTESIDMQQNTRVAFDKLVSDVRMAGFDFDRDGIPTGVTARTWEATTTYALNEIVMPTTPNGHQYICITGGQSSTSEPTWPTALNGTVDETAPGTARWQENSGINVYQQPDEQVEYAGQTAITIRANYDYDAKQTTDRFNGRETTLENAYFPVVTTGNDEIVTYALTSDKGPNAGVITFTADVNASGTPTRRAYPGGAAERTVTIDGVDLTNANPPYTLYRITLDNAANIVRTPVANNIRSMRFKYYEDTTGDSPLMSLDATPVDVSNGIGGGGAYDPDSAEAVVPDRLIRAKIRAIQVELFGMNPNTEKSYVDPIPPWNATASTDRDTVSPATRKVKLSSLVVPRNFGKRGLREQATTEPGQPKVTNVCIGYCGVVKLTWDAPATGGVTSYAIAYDTSAGGNFVQTIQVGPVTTGYVYGLVPDQQYFFKILAINDYGASASDPIKGPYVPKSRTTPGDPTNLAATGATSATRLPGQINVTWNAATAFGTENQLSCDSGSATGTPTSGESITYNVWRSTTSTVNTAGAPYVSYTANGSSVVTNNATGVVTFTDTSTAPCIDYYYKIQAVKTTCEPNANYYVAPSVPHSAIIPASGTPPKGSAALTAGGPATPSDLVVVSTSTCTAGSCTVDLSWPKVGTDTSGNRLTVDVYEISRTQKLNGTDTTAVSSPTSTIGANTWVGTQVLTSSNWANNLSGTATYTDTVAEADAGAGSVSYSYEYKVRAVVCSTPGTYSVVRTFPCPFGGGTVGASVSSSFQGTGSIADPYYVNSPVTITGSTASSVQSAHGLLYLYSGGSYTLIRDLGTNTGPLTSTSFSGGTLTVGSEYMAEITYTDNSGCTKRARIYLINEGIGCCLQNLATSSAVVSFTAGTTSYVDVYMRNICGSDLTLQTNGISVTYSQTGLTGSPTPKIDKVEYPTTLSSGTGVANCTFDASQKCFTYTFGGNTSDSNNPFLVPIATAAKVITANTTTYRFRVKFTQNLSRQPITGLTILYRRSSDLANVSCPVIP